MEEKRKDLKNTRQKESIDDILLALSKKNPSFYYLSTIEVAAEVKNYVHSSDELSTENHDLLKDLTRHDIQMLLSLH